MDNKALVTLIGVSIAFSAGWFLRIAWTDLPDHRALMEPLGLITVALVALWIGRKDRD